MAPLPPPALPALNCGGCTACCRKDTITIRPGEPHKRWKTDFDPATGARTLRKGKFGDCIYLGARGCTIHGKAPTMCREFDCRRYALKVRAMPPAERARRLEFSQTARPIAEGERRLEALGIRSA